VIDGRANICRIERRKTRHAADPRLPVGCADPAFLQGQRENLLRQEVQGRLRRMDLLDVPGTP
jgi:hypothetical protein